MTTAGGFGNSSATPVKLVRVAKILPWVIKMSTSHVRRFGGRFWYVDANAGPARYQGINGEPLLGSPVIALMALRHLDVPYHAVLIDRDPDTFESLRRVLTELDLLDPRRVVLRCEDNRRDLPVVCQFAGGRRDRGLIFFDPKGAPDWPLMETVMSLPSMECVDVLVNVATVTLKLERKAAQSDRFGGKGYKWDTKDVRPLADRLPMLHKRRYLIGAPHGRWGWSLILGSNWPGFPEWRAGLMDASDGPIGGPRLDDLSRTRDERETS